MSVIGSLSSLEALVFFRGPARSVSCSHFSCVDVVLGFVSSTVSSFTCPIVKSGPPSSHVRVAPVACAITTFSVILVCSVVAFAASQKALTLAANCSLHFY